MTKKARPPLQAEVRSCGNGRYEFLKMQLETLQKLKQEFFPGPPNQHLRLAFLICAIPQVSWGEHKDGDLGAMPSCKDDESLGGSVEWRQWSYRDFR